MNKDVLVATLMDRTQLPRRRAELLLEVVCSQLRVGLCRGERVELRHFGSLLVRRQQLHVNVHPTTGARRDVPTRHCVLFRPSKGLRARLNAAAPAS